MRLIKYILLLPAVLLTACNKYDIQPGQAEGFIKFFSSTLTEVAYDVKETADGGYIAVGTTSDEGGIRDIYLVNTDKYGNEESWSPVTIGGEYDDVGTSIQVVDDGFVILGYSKRTDTTAYDMYLVKTNLQGNILWEKWAGIPGDINGIYDDRGLSLQITSTGEYLAAGIRENTVSHLFDFRLVRFDSGGNILKDRIIPSGAVQASVDKVYVIETSAYYMLCGTISYEQKNEIMIVPVFKDSHLWDGFKLLTSEGNLQGNCIQELSDGNLLICGTDYNLQTGRSDIYLHKLSSSLGTVTGWESPRRFTVQNDQVSLSGNSVRVIDVNSYAIIGTRTETGNEDIILLHSDAGGNEISRSIFGDEGFQRGISLEVSGDGGLILVGNNGSEDNSMMALVKTDATGKL